MTDVARLADLARAAQQPRSVEFGYAQRREALASFQVAVTPAVVLALVAEVEGTRASLDQAIDQRDRALAELDRERAAGLEREWSDMLIAAEPCERKGADGEPLHAPTFCMCERAHRCIWCSFDDAVLRADLAEQGLEAVAAIHSQNKHFPFYCVSCRSEYPCRTVRALAPVQEGQPQ